MTKKWIIVASTFIVVGIIGLLFTKFDINNSTSVKFEHEWEYDGTTIEAFDIRGTSSNIDVEFTTSADQKTYIYIKGETDAQIIEQIRTASVKNNTFILEMDAQKQMRLISVGIERNRIDMIVALPNNQQLNDVKVKTSSGDLTISNLQAKQANIEASSGHIKVKNSLIDNLSASTSSGHIKFTAHQGDIDARLTSGNVKIDQIEGHSQVRTTSGNVSIEQQKEGDMTVESTSGDVDLVQRVTGNASIQTTSGNIKMTLGNNFAGSINTITNSGNISRPETNVNQGTPSNHQINLKTTSGNIKIN